MLIRSLVDGHVGCSHFLGIMDNAAMNISVQILHGHVSSWVYTQEWNCSVTWQLYS